MTTLMEPRASKGLAMVASYRAARLSGRAALRNSMRRTEAAPAARRAMRGEDGAAGDAPPVATPPEAGVQAGAAESASIFAGLISLSAAGRDDLPAPRAAVQPESPPAAAAPDMPPRIVAPEPAVPEVPELAVPELAVPELAVPELAVPELAVPAKAASQAAPVPPASTGAAQAPPDAPPDAPSDDPPLAEIGFGPGMLIRLSQAGLHTVGDLAQADVAQLRSALGDISRLVDVSTWISSARQSAAAHK